MAKARQLDKAWGHLWDDPNGVVLSRAGAKDVWILATMWRTPDSVVPRLRAPSLSRAQREALREAGWGPPRPGDWLTSTLSGELISPQHDRNAFYQWIARSLALATGQATELADIRVSLRDIGDDGGWAQFGCALAVPGAIVGAVVGAVASTHTPFLADVGLALWALVGAIIAVAGGGLIAGAVLRLGMLVRAPRRIKEPLSIVGWLVGSLVTAVLFGSILWTLMGW